MFETMEFLTPAVVRALRLAQRIAATERATAVAPRHLATALLGGEPEGLAATSAARNGYQSDAVLMQVEPLDANITPIDVLSRDVLAALRDARQIASEVTGEILLCVLMDKELELLDLLKSGGLDVAAFRKAVFSTNLEPITVIEPLHISASSDASATARILDANINRAREAARVLEDYARFCLNDAMLSRTCKTMRHELRDLSTDFGLAPLSGRDTPHDVGTAFSTEGEFRRADIHSVVIANAKRLQEALRSLEEFGKVIDAQVAQRIKGLRYQSYAVESAFAGVAQGRKYLADVRLYWLFTGASCRISPELAVREAVAGGVQMIQLREKSLTDTQLLVRAREMRRWTRELQVPFIVNDRPDIARLADADGVHLGQDDLPVAAARSMLGPDAIIGVSTHAMEQVHRAVRDGANYIGVGPTFSSSTKDFRELAGLEFVSQVAAETSLPAFVLGGVTPKNLPDVIAAGGRRIAVSAAISTSEHPRATALTLANALANS
ncbi:MAG: thiamine phosphate synthase [Gemmataceae bacterium]